MSDKIVLKPDEVVAYMDKKDWKYGRVKGISLDGWSVMLENLDNDKVVSIDFKDVYRLTPPNKKEP